MIVSSFLWRLAPSAAVDPDCARLAAEHGLSDRLVGMLSSLSGCVVYGRPAPARYYHRWYR